LNYEILAKLCGTSAPDLTPSLAGFNNLFTDNILRQSLLRSGAAYQLRWTCKTNVLQVAPAIYQTDFFTRSKILRLTP